MANNIRKYLPRFRAKAIIDPDQWRNNPGSLDLLTSFSVYSTYLAMYKNSLSIRSVISFRANNAATVPVRVLRRVDKDIREAVYDHGLQVTLHKPNPETSGFVFIRDLCTDTDLFDCSYWLKVRAGSRLLLIRQYPDAVRHLGDPMFPDAFRIIQRDGSTKDYKREDIFWTHGYGGGKGISPMEALKSELEIDDAEKSYRIKQSKQGWRNTGVIRRPKTAGAWTQEKRDRFITEMSARYSIDGQFASRPLLLEDDMEWINDSQTSGMGDYTAARGFTTKQVLFAFHMSPQAMGVEGAPYSSLVEYKNQVFQINLKPFFKFQEDEFEMQLLPEFTDFKDIYAEFNIDAMLQGDPALQAQIGAVALAGNPWFEVDEWRAMVYNLGPAKNLPQKAGSAPTAPTGWPGNMSAAPAFPAPPGAATPPAPGSQPPKPSDFSFSSLGEGLAYIRSKYIDFWKHKTVAQRGDRGELFLYLFAFASELGQLISAHVNGSYDRAKTVGYMQKQAEIYSKSDVDVKDMTDQVMSWVTKEVLMQNDRLN